MAEKHKTSLLLLFLNLFSNFHAVIIKIQNQECRSRYHTNRSNLIHQILYVPFVYARGDNYLKNKVLKSSYISLLCVLTIFALKDRKLLAMHKGLPIPIEVPHLLRSEVLQSEFVVPLEVLTQFLGVY